MNSQIKLITKRIVDLEVIEKVLCDINGGLKSEAQKTVEISALLGHIKKWKEEARDERDMFIEEYYAPSMEVDNQSIN